MKETPAQFKAAAKPDQEWLSANEEVVELGLEWVAAKLSGAAFTEARDAYDEARDRLSAAGTPAGIDRVASSFNLAPFDEDVLLLALAPEIDGSFGPRYGAIQGRLTTSPATPHLISVLLFGRARIPSAALLRLARDAPLRRYALIVLDEAADLPIGAAITLPERIRNLICGIDGPDALLADRVKVLDEVPVPDSIDCLAVEAAELLSRSNRIQLIGPTRSGRRALASAALSRLGFGALAVRADAKLESVAATLARDAILNSCGIVVETAEAGETSGIRALEQRLSAPVVVIADAPVQGLEHMPILRLERLDSSARAEIWQRCAPDYDCGDIAQVAEQFALGPNEISALSGHAALSEKGLWKACRDLGDPDLEALATRIIPKRCWDDMVLPDETRSDLRALASQIGGRPLVHGEWGFGKILGRSTGVSTLFAGPSGVGKTMAAEVVANALELDLYIVDLARVTSKYIGETEKNLRRIFDAAEGSGAVLFFDEADALFGKRSEVKDSHDRYANGEISYLLQRMECYSGLAILATNLKSHLDTAFLRRLRVVVDFIQPGTDQRQELWKRSLPESAPKENIDWGWLARIELTGGNITTVAANAAFRAAAEGSSIEMKHLRSALRSELRKLDREPLEASI